MLAPDRLRRKGSLGAPVQTDVNATDEKPKAVRRHINVSKVKTEIDGKDYTFRLTRKGLVIRRWHSRKTKVLSFSQLLDLSIEQRQLL